MKLLKTIEKIILEAEERYNTACDSYLPEKEIKKLEKDYNDSLKLIDIYHKSKK
jgi:hypothetical protein